MTVVEAFKKMGISTSKLYQLVAARATSHYRIDSKIVLSEDDIAAFLSSCRVGTTKAYNKTALLKPRLKHLKRAWGVLPSALWSQNTDKPVQRSIQWDAYGTAIRLVFTGGIIMVCNRNMGDNHPELRALKSRINVLKLDVTDDEMQALMKRICASGYEFDGMSIHSRDCLEVRQFVIDRLTAMNPPDASGLPRS
jgi:hypothetical protein